MVAAATPAMRDAAAPVVDFQQRRPITRASFHARRVPAIDARMPHLLYEHFKMAIFPCDAARERYDD